MKIFISHAVIDGEIAKAFVDFLDTGMGVPPDFVFFSSQGGSIQNGDYFVRTIMDNLRDARLQDGRIKETRIIMDIFGLMMQLDAFTPKSPSQ